MDIKACGGFSRASLNVWQLSFFHSHDSTGADKHLGFELGLFYVHDKIKGMKLERHTDTKRKEKSR
jgi:hypothetical protein